MACSASVTEKQSETQDLWNMNLNDNSLDLSEGIGHCLEIIGRQLEDVLVSNSANLSEELVEKLSLVKKNVALVRNAVDVVDTSAASKEEEFDDWTSIQQGDLANWERLGEGGFSRVFKARRTEGNEIVAVKVLHEGALEGPLKEGKLLSKLRHKNIVAFRGMNVLTEDVEEFGLPQGAPFIVMEFVGDNLGHYVESQRTAESQGLHCAQVWDFARQIANGLHYLHTLKPPGPIAHRDLKPDNILLDKGPFKMYLKLADFGLSTPSTVMFDTSGSMSVRHARWQAPEVWLTVIPEEEEEEQEEEEEREGENELSVEEDQHEASDEFEEDYESDIEFYMRADVYSFGMITAYMLTGNKPWKGRRTFSINDARRYGQGGESMIELPTNLTGDLLPIITRCYHANRFERPSLQDLLNEYFQTDTNPYQSTMEGAAFFSCGFLKDTHIFVADSLVDDESSGYFKSKVRQGGYPLKCLSCEVEVRNDAYKTCPDDWEYEEQYRDRFRHWRKAALNKEIEDNPAIALKRLAMPREDLEEKQEILLQFGQSTYCHHRAMRDIWRSLDEATREVEVPCKGTIHPVFSTSFGLHVAVLTADKPQKFIFARRANRGGMASPRTITCGAVESAAIKDYEEKDGKTYVNLVKTAARGLDEELRVELKGGDLQAISLSTVYLKYDTHEWGLCGYVDLSDERIAKERRLTYEQLKSRFTAGPKDKFEHEEVVPVDFNLPDMVDYVRSNYRDFASSGKLVVVKVLQSFFGVAEVERAFQIHDDDLHG